MNLLELKHLKKSFDELEVIKDFSLSVKEGEVVSSASVYINIRKVPTPPIPIT